MIDIGPRRELELPKSGIYVADGALCKETGKHQQIGRHALETIERAELVTQVDWTGVILTLGLAALAVVAKLYLPVGWDWAAGILLLAFAAMCALGIRSLRLMLRCTGGDVRYELSEMRPDCEGFVVSLNDLLATKWRPVAQQPAATSTNPSADAPSPA